MCEITLMRILVVQPVGDFLNVRRHVQIVIHSPFSQLITAGPREGTPTTVGQDFGKAFRSLGTDSIFAPPLSDFGLVWRSGAAFVYPADTIGELDEAANVVRGRVIISEFTAAAGLTHGPGCRSVTVKPAGIVDQVREHMCHPTGRAAVDSMDPPQSPAHDDLLNLLIVFTVSMLVTHYRFHPCLLQQLADAKQLRTRQGRRLFECNQFRATGNRRLDE